MDARVDIFGKTVVIVQSDSTVYGPTNSTYPFWLRGLYAMAAGDVKITTHDDIDEVWTCPAGFYIPRHIKKVWDTGTTVSDANLKSGE